MSYYLHLEYVSAGQLLANLKEQLTSGPLAVIPGVRFEASACNWVENSELAPRAGCTDNTISLDAYAILATVAQRVSQPWTTWRA